MTIKNWISYTGIFTYPIVAFLFNLIVDGLQDTIPFSPTVKIIIVYVLPILYPIIITVTNIQRQKRGQTDFSFSSVYGLGEKEPRHSKEYLDKAYPDVPKEYRSSIPTGFVIGKHKGKYCYCPIKSDGVNGMVLGSPGSGKSVMLLGWLYSMLYREEIGRKGHTKPNRAWNFFLVDIKGELFEKVLGIKSKDYIAEEHLDFHVVQPSNRSSYGWDVFYRIHKPNVSETEMIKAVTDIADALIVSSGDDAYFTDNAKKILTGVLYFYAKQGMEFLPIIQKLMRTNLDELLTAIVEEAESKHWGIVLDKLKGFVGKSDNESIADIETTLKTYLDVFSYPDIKFCFHDNTYKTSPAALNDGKTNMDLAIEEAMLTVYQPIFRLITMQILRHCESDFHEDDDRHTCLILDEASRIGYVNGMDSAMATLRSKKCSLICLFQSISQFKDIYPEQKANTLLNLCELKVVLSGSGDQDTTEYISKMVGDYDVTKMSYQRKGVLGGRSDGNYSQERRPIIEARDLMELRMKNEAICFIYGRYFRCKKLRYFEDQFIAPILKNKKK